MKSRSLTTALAILLTVSLVAPPAFFVAPQKVHAQYAVTVVGDIVGWVQQTITAIKSTITSVATVTSAAANVAMQIDAYVLQPLAFVLSGNLLKLITAGVIAFVIGKANGTGIPQFVVDVRKSFQTVSDARSLAYFDQYMRSSRSPYSGSIVDALRKEYLNRTSLAGFWAANMDTLARSSPNVNAYLAGNWSQGGVAAWFALTTQIQNNPYTAYPAAKDQLGNLIGPGAGGATGARAAELAWGQGFASWCGSSDGFLGSITTSSSQLSNALAAYEAANIANNNARAAYDANPNDATKAAVDKAAAAVNAAGTRVAAAKAASNASPLGVNPGDPCTNADGTAGTIKTPGSVITAGLNKVLGGQQDQVVRMGNVGPQINQILGNIATVLKTVDFAAKILGGPGSGGLFGVDQTSGSNSTSRLMQYQAAPGNLGVTNSGVYKTAATLPSSGPDMLNRVAQYESAWNTITAATNTASTSVTSLINLCTAAATTASTAVPPDTAFISAATAQASAARTALVVEIAPVLARAATASTTIAAARAMVQKVQTELNSGAEGSGGAYLADVQTLQAMPPSPSDVANVQQDVQVFNTAAASPSGSLAVSGGSLVDQMALINTNATALRTVCTPPAPSPSSPS